MVVCAMCDLCCVWRCAAGLAADATAARFLYQATFGPTAAAVKELVAGAGGQSPTTAQLSKWVHAQIQAPATSLREYYRSRAAARSRAYPVQSDRCEAGSRWN